MAFVGIAIVNVFVMWTHDYFLPRTLNPTSSVYIPPISVTEPRIEERVVYLGQFDQLEECQRAGSTPNVYVLEPGESFVEPQMVRTLCATPDGTEWVDHHD